MSDFPFTLQINSGYSYSSGDNLENTELLHGQSIRMKRYDRPKKTLQTTLSLTRSEAAQFWDFYDLNRGSVFNVMIDDNGSIEPKEVRFIGYPSADGSNVTVINISFSLLIEKSNIDIYFYLESIGAINTWRQEDDSGLIGQIENVDLTLNGNGTPIPDYESRVGSSYDLLFSGLSSNASITLRSDAQYYTFQNELSFGWFVKTEGVSMTLAQRFWCGDPAGINFFPLYGGGLTQGFNSSLATSQGGGATFSTQNAFPEGEYFIAFVKSESANPQDTFDFYINGVLYAQITYNINPPSSNSQKICFFKGNLDNFYACPFLFDRALTQTELTQIQQIASL